MILFLITIQHLHNCLHFSNFFKDFLNFLVFPIFITYNEYKESIKQIVEEYGIKDTPILLNMSFGHNEPMFTIPYGVMAEIDCDKKEFSIIEAGVK